MEALHGVAAQQRADRVPRLVQAVGKIVALTPVLLRGAPVTLVVPSGDLARADADALLALFGLAASGLRLLGVSGTPAVGAGLALARVDAEREPTTVWASRAPEAALPRADWGSSAMAPIVRGEPVRPRTPARRSPRRPLLRGAPGTALVESGPNWTDP